MSEDTIPLLDSDAHLKLHLTFQSQMNAYHPMNLSRFWDVSCVLCIWPQGVSVSLKKELQTLSDSEKQAPNKRYLKHFSSIQLFHPVRWWIMKI